MEYFKKIVKYHHVKCSKCNIKLFDFIKPQRYGTTPQAKMYKKSLKKLPTPYHGMKVTCPNCNYRHAYAENKIFKIKTNMVSV